MATVSIILRLKNEAKHVGKVLAALAEQTYRDFEIVVVDSGSTDRTLEIVAPYHPVIVHIRPEEFTYGYALNVGAAASSGRYLVSLSGHSIPTDGHWLERLVDACAPNWAAAAFSRLVPYPGGPWRYRFIYWYLYPPTVRRQFGQHAYHNASSIFKAELWRRFPFDEHLGACEDQDWARKVIKLGYEIVYEPRSAVFHAHDESVPRWLHRTFVNEMPAFFRVWWRHERPRLGADEPLHLPDDS